MSYGIKNIHSYNIHQENEALSVISHLNEFSIIDITTQSYNQRFDFEMVLPITNLPATIEQTFKQTEQLYPNDIEELERTKNSLYRSILNTISSCSNCVFEDVDDSILYGLVYYVYDFFISNFKQYIIMFFSNYIIKEKNSIYSEMNLSMYKKEKNLTTKYGKTNYNNPKIAIIISYLDKILTNMSTFDISFENILSNIYSDNNIINLLNNNISCDNFYLNHYISILNMPWVRQSIISNIRFNIHNSMI